MLKTIVFNTAAAAAADDDDDTSIRLTSDCISAVHNNPMGYTW